MIYNSFTLTLDIYSESKSCNAWRTALHSATILSLRSSRVHEESAINAAPLIILSSRSSKEGRCSSQFTRSIINLIPIIVHCCRSTLGNITYSVYSFTNLFQYKIAISFSCSKFWMSYINLEKAVNSIVECFFKIARAAARSSHFNNKCTSTISASISRRVTADKRFLAALTMLLLFRTSSTAANISCFISGFSKAICSPTSIKFSNNQMFSQAYDIIDSVFT
ncbi:hypothetical protein AGLY_007600, partial [Aphis glycines]